MRAFDTVGKANDLSVGSYAERPRVAIRKVVPIACAYFGERVFTVGQGSRRECCFTFLCNERGAYFSWLIEDAIDLDLVAVAIGDGEGGCLACLIRERFAASILHHAFQAQDRRA